MSLKITKPKYFQVKISNCGLDSLSSSYKLLKDKDAILLSLKVCSIISENFVGKETQPEFLYELAINLLAQLDGCNPADIQTDIENHKNLKFESIYKLKDDSNNEEVKIKK